MKMAATLVACNAVFHPGPDCWASGKDEPASDRSAGAVGGLACAHRGWAPLRLAADSSLYPLVSWSKATYAPSGGGLS